MDRYLLSLQDVSLKFNDVSILENINLNIQEGEFHVLLGENGAGKTSIINILCGLYHAGQYTGTITYDGQLLALHSTNDAIKKGIVTVHQDPALYDEMSIAENYYAVLASVRQKHYYPSLAAQNKDAAHFFQEHGLNIDVSRKVSHLSLSQRRAIELLMLYLKRPKLLLLDEPVEVLDDGFQNEFYKLLDYFAQIGTTVLCITHEYSLLLPYVTHFSILRDRILIGTLDKASFLKQNVVSLLWGDFLERRYPKIPVKRGSEVLCAEHLNNGGIIKDVSLTLYKREILGIYGRVGAGKSSLAKMLFGLEPIISGKIYIDRLEASIGSPHDAIEYGLAYITDERREYGIFPTLDSLENVYSLGKTSSRNFWINKTYETKRFLDYSKHLNMSITPERKPYNLSGGEQQKLLLMRWLMSSSSTFIFDEPTLSVDIPSKIDIYNLFNDLVMKDASIIICSSNLEELMGICDRTLIMNQGKITQEVSYDDKDDFIKMFNH